MSGREFPAPCGFCLASLAAAFQRYTVNAAPLSPQFRPAAAPPAPRNRPGALFPVPLLECFGRGPCVTHPWHRGSRFSPLCWRRQCRADRQPERISLARRRSSSGSTTTATSRSLSRVPDAVQALSESGALREPETAGFYVGFVAGVLGANPKEAEHLVDKMLPLPPADQWLVVRAIAYSGLPAWKSLLARTAAQAAGAARHDRRLSHRRAADARRDRTRQEPDVSRKGRASTSASSRRRRRCPTAAIPNCSTRCGASISPPASTGRSGASSRCCRGRRSATAPSGSTVGSSAKYTLANNAARYPDILALIKDMAAYQEADVRPILTEVIHAAETTETAGDPQGAVRAGRQAQEQGPGLSARPEDLGLCRPGRDRRHLRGAGDDVAVAAGLPCVIGGAATSAALNYWAAQ